ncbi:3-oxo-5-alpha-steroid 4-dehydrogenase, partial [Toxoplasma gondii TgCatPRC2]
LLRRNSSVAFAWKSRQLSLLSAFAVLLGERVSSVARSVSCSLCCFDPTCRRGSRSACDLSSRVGRHDIRSVSPRQLHAASQSHAPRSPSSCGFCRRPREISGFVRVQDDPPKSQRRVGSLQHSSGRVFRLRFLSPLLGRNSHLPLPLSALTFATY